MSEQYDALKNAIDSITRDVSTERAAIELFYTASEVGILNFSVKDDAIKEIIAVVRLAEKFSGHVPDELRM